MCILHAIAIVYPMSAHIKIYTMFFEKFVNRVSPFILNTSNFVCHKTKIHPSFDETYVSDWRPSHFEFQNSPKLHRGATVAPLPQIFTVTWKNNHPESVGGKALPLPPSPPGVCSSVSNDSESSPAASFPASVSPQSAGCENITPDAQVQIWEICDQRIATP